MKINQIIREKRKELSLTQEQIAEFLGVSTPAVNKWEKGISYPDITLLPALARLLKTDLNTLMSFNEDLSDIEIENFVNELGKIIVEKNYEAAFQEGLNKIHEYPTCDMLIYTTIIYLEGALTLYSVPNPEQYQKVFETFYKRLTESDIQEIRDTATSMLISYARNSGDYLKAEELINTLPFSKINKEEQLAILFRCQGKYDDAEKIWEHRVLKGVTDIQTALINMIEKSLIENNNQDAEYFADLYENITHKFCFPEWIRYNAHLQIYLENKDRAKCMAILKKMLPAMKKEWNSQDYKLYRNLNNTSGSTSFSSKIVDSFCMDLSTNEKYSFIVDCDEFKELMAQIKT